MPIGCFFRKSPCFSRLQRLPTLSRTLPNQIRVLKAVRCGVRIGATALKNIPSQIETYQGFSKMETALSGSKILLDMMTVPKKVVSLRRSFKRMGREASLLRTTWSEKRKIDKQALLETSIQACNILEKSLSISGKIFYKPLAFVGEHVQFGMNTSLLGRQWNVLSLVESGAHIFKITGKLIQRKKIFKHSVDLLFEGSDVTFQALSLARVPVHPGISLTFQAGKNLYGLWRIWEATASPPAKI